MLLQHPASCLVPSRCHLLCCFFLFFVFPISSRLGLPSRLGGELGATWRGRRVGAQLYPSVLPPRGVTCRRGGRDPDVERGVAGVTVGAHAGQSLQKPHLNCFSREFGSVWKTSGGQSWGDASKGPRGCCQCWRRKGLYKELHPPQPSRLESTQTGGSFSTDSAGCEIRLENRLFNNNSKNQPCECPLGSRCWLRSDAVEYFKISPFL